MAVATYILALDPATRTGWARGEPGQKPEYGAIVIRQPKEPWSVGFHNYGGFLGDIMRDRLPDLIVFEKPLDPYQWFAMGKKLGRPQNGESLTSQHGLAGVLYREAGRRQIDVIEVDRQDVLGHFTGRRSWSSGKNAGDGRELGKKAVIAQCVRLGIVPATCRDDDRCDAIANHDYASALYGRAIPAQLMLHDQGRLRHG